jgi:hypothetical protein
LFGRDSESSLGLGGNFFETRTCVMGSDKE